ncbi:unnamed protein product [Prunus armeniaca]|uniref:Uncharacterized protein n=1 Tax=Prunus armeniaca TaxID=36596 RepID=A0A6J5TZ82_PRUAR|nr:unnamed protein product [Prunus armeniaca]
MMIEHGILPNNITHQALVLGFRKKRVMNPVETANLKLQQILLKYGIHVDVDEYLREQPRKLQAITSLTRVLDAQVVSLLIIRAGAEVKH